MADGSTVLEVDERPKKQNDLQQFFFTASNYGSVFEECTTRFHIKQPDFVVASCRL